MAGVNGANELLARVPQAGVMLVPDAYPTQIWVSPIFARAFLPAPVFAGSIRLLPSPALARA